MPFITEELYQHLEARSEHDTIMRAPLPQVDHSAINPQIEQEMAFLQEVVSAVRQIRSEMNIPPSQSVNFAANCHEKEKISVLENNLAALKKLCKLDSTAIGIGQPKPGYAASAVVKGQEIYIPLEGLIDINVEKERLQKEITRLEGQLRGVLAKLQNENFVSKAPKDILEKEQSKKQNFQQTLEKLKSNLAQLAG